MIFMKRTRILAKLISAVLIALLLMSTATVYAAEGGAGDAAAGSENGGATSSATENYDSAPAGSAAESDYEFFGEVPYEEALAESTPMLARGLLGNVPEALGPLFDSGMPKTGEAKVVGICVDFADMRFDAGDDEAALEEIINAEIDEENPYYPFESLHAYYKSGATSPR